jgi:SAM-dependent methyltransferase
MSTGTAQMRRIRYLSQPAAVSMSNDWYGAATLEHFWTERRFEVLCRLAGELLPQSSAMAEVGCGHGLLQRQIEDFYGREVTGIDLNEMALKQTISRISPVCCYDVFQLSPEYEGSFDLIFLFDVLEHIRDEETFVNAIQFHLAPGGKIVINVPAMPSMYSKFDLAVGHFRRYKIDSLQRVAERTGMRISAWSYWGLPLMPLLLLRKLWLAGRSEEGIIPAGFDSRGPLMNRLLLWASRCEVIPQRLMGSALMAVFEKST